jgi:uncharacterized Fe-S cluster-containing protein
MVLTKNFDFLNESTIEFQFKDKIINLISRVENSLKEDEIPNTILNDCRTIYEYIVLQIGLIKGVKINEFEDRTKVKDT